MSFFGGVWHGLDEAFFMFWETLWALVLGFGLSGAVQAFVSRGEMRKALGDHRPATLGKASFFGVISSSCSYASSALAKSLFARGADFTAAMVFMIASTNLVVELGIVLWLLIGWQFALAEFVGGAIMIVLLGLVVPRVIPQSWITEARDRLNADTVQASAGGAGPHAHHAMAGMGMELEDSGPDEHQSLRQRIRSRAGWGDASGYTISDLTMVRKELVIGFVTAGFLAALVPTGFWRSLFLTGHGFWSSLENVVLGPLLAIISFVCSVGNVPLAAALWQGGISFGGVVSFVFADLITLPLLSIYRKYFGTAITLRLLATFWATMSIAGLAVEYLFRAIRISDPVRPRIAVRTGFEWNYTTVLNILALLAFAVIYWLYRHRDTSGHRYAKDPVCGMQVEIEHAPATAREGGAQYWFCSDHCQHRFTADPSRYLTTATGSAGEPAGSLDRIGGQPAVDPVCGMTVNVASAEHAAEHQGTRYYFCGAGCRAAFLTDPESYLTQAPAVAPVGGVLKPNAPGDPGARQ
ncbi:MAG: hypothetical protein JWN95_1755 [Frankiales bacterium]|nr:hypothetical protein [Frankiales bacterium]